MNSFNPLKHAQQLMLITVIKRKGKKRMKNNIQFTTFLNTCNIIKYFQILMSLM